MTASLRDPLHVYWQPGCSACLRMKEFLVKHGVEFVSINVLADESGREELIRLAGRRVPIARRGDDWADGQVLRDLARVAGISWDGGVSLSPSELRSRIDRTLSLVALHVGELPDGQLESLLPGRPRTYRRLIVHVAQIVEAFLDQVEHGKRLEFAAYDQDVLPGCDRKDLVDYIQRVRQRLDAWWRVRGTSMSFSAPASVYYGSQSLHEYFERTAWHSTQHTRQFELVLQTLGIAPSDRLSAKDLEGLPVPVNVWDDKLAFEPEK